MSRGHLSKTWARTLFSRTAKASEELMQQGVLYWAIEAPREMKKSMRESDVPCCTTLISRAPINPNSPIQSIQTVMWFLHDTTTFHQYLVIKFEETIKNFLTSAPYT